MGLNSCCDALERCATMGHALAEISPWVLRFDLVSGRALLWVVEVRRAGEVHPEVYLYLADRYWRLAAHYERRGRPRWAQRLAAKANRYRELGAGESGPRA